MVFGRVYCCGGKTEKAFVVAFYVPEEMRVQLGDLAEVKSGPGLRHGEIGTPVNTITRKVDKSACRWDPPGSGLQRVLYCDWMEREGWKRYQGGPTEASVWMKEP